MRPSKLAHQNGSPGIRHAILMVHAVMKRNPSRFMESSHPVEQVSWDTVVDFLDRLDPDVHLPTEAEWEHACRADSEGPPWAGAAGEHELGRVAWFDKNSDDSTHPVGEMAPNPWGLYDMLGNVWEWCVDGKVWALDEPMTDPWIREASDRVYRGGAWDRSARNCRAAYRSASRPSSEWRALGFRLARGPQRPSQPASPAQASPDDRAAQARGAAGASEGGRRRGGR